MTDYSDPVSVHPTLTASQQDRVALMKAYSTFEILSRGGDYIYFRTDGLDAVVRAPGTTVIPPGGSLKTSMFAKPNFPYDGSGYIHINLISESAVPYSIQGVTQ